MGHGEALDNSPMKKPFSTSDASRALTQKVTRDVPKEDSFVELNQDQRRSKEHPNSTKLQKLEEDLETSMDID